MATGKQQENNERFLRLEERHRNFIRKLCWKRAHGDREQFLQLVQEVYVDLYDALCTQEISRAREVAWIFWRCRGVFTAYRRSRDARFLPLDEALAYNMAEDNSAVLISDTLDDLSADLNERQREILSLYRQGYSMEEIASELHIKPASVGKALRRMTEKMRKYNDKINRTS